MYELLTGFPPLYGKDKFETYKKKAENVFLELN